MPVSRRSAPTLESVTRKLAEFEHRYGINTAHFVAVEGRIKAVRENDGMEWLYLFEQLRTLQEAAVVHSYSRSYVSACLKNSESVLECLAA